MSRQDRLPGRIARAVAASSGAWTELAEVDLSGDGAIQFASISASYFDLMLIGDLRGTNAAERFLGGLRFNADTGNNYNSVTFFSSTAGINQGGFVAGAYAGIAAADAGTTYIGLTGDSATANRWSPFQVVIPNYRSAHHKCMTSHTGNSNATATTLSMSSAWWLNTAAITQIDFWNATGATGTFKSGSHVVLLGRVN